MKPQGQLVGRGGAAAPDLSRRLLWNAGRRPAKEALGEHRRLLQAIKARDADLAEKLARAHRRKTLQLRRGMVREHLRKTRS
jgi:DNA-binding GntR family transcriptional regulator